MMILNKLCSILTLILVAPLSTSFAQEKNTKTLIKVGVIQSNSHLNFDADASGLEKALGDR